jgi:hypothetical protein
VDRSACREASESVERYCEDDERCARSRWTFWSCRPIIVSFPCGTLLQMYAAHRCGSLLLLAACCLLLAACYVLSLLLLLLLLLLGAIAMMLVTDSNTEMSWLHPSRCQGKTLTFGFSLRRQSRPWECPVEFNQQHVLCEAPSTATFQFSPAGRPVIEDFSTVVKRAAALGNGSVTMTVATYDYAEGALLWYEDLVANGCLSGLVVALDWGAYKYLVNRRVPVVLEVTENHLDVCCLRRFRMVPWRSTNDVKVHASVLRVQPHGCLPACSV